MNYINETYDVANLNYFLSKRYVLSDEATVKRITNAIVLPDSDMLFDDNSSNLSEAQWNEESPLAVVYLGCLFTAHYGNLLFDYISRLWWQEKNVNNYPWVFTAPKNVKTPPLLYQLAELVGIERNHLIRVTEPTRFAEVIIPQPTFIHDKYIMPEYAAIYNRMYLSMQQQDREKYDKIYLTRTHLKRHKEVGEKRFERFFTANGFKVVAPEELDLAEQAYLIRHCKELASIEGSHAHGVVWCECGHGGGQIVLRKQSEVIPRQIMFNRLWQRDLIVVDVFEEPFKGFPISHDRGPFLLRWTKEMEQFAQDNHMVVPKECRRGYWLDWIEYALKCIMYKVWHVYKHRKD